MQQSHIHDPFKPIDFPPCPRCGSQMWLSRIEPTDKPAYDQRTLECHRCEHSESMIVKSSNSSLVFAGRESRGG